MQSKKTQKQKLCRKFVQKHGAAREKYAKYFYTLYRARPLRVKRGYKNKLFTILNICYKQRLRPKARRFSRFDIPFAPPRRRAASMDEAKLILSPLISHPRRQTKEEPAFLRIG